MTSATAPQGIGSYILFSVAGTTYALPSAEVRHMEMLESITRVPNAPAFVDGVVFSRGQVVPVVNLRARFGFDRAEFDLRTRLIVVQAGGAADRSGRRFGARVRHHSARCDSAAERRADRHERALRRRDRVDGRSAGPRLESRSHR